MRQMDSEREREDAQVARGRHSCPGWFSPIVRERVASAVWKEGEGGNGRGRWWRWRASGRTGGRMDSFIFLVDLAYISPPPEADTKTNGLSSRSYKTSPPSTSPYPARRSPTRARRRRRRYRCAPPPPRLAIECKCKTLKRRANLLGVLSDAKSRALVWRPRDKKQWRISPRWRD